MPGIRKSIRGWSPDQILWLCYDLRVWSRSITVIYWELLCIRIQLSFSARQISRRKSGVSPRVTDPSNGWNSRRQIVPAKRSFFSIILFLRLHIEIYTGDVFSIGRKAFHQDFGKKASLQCIQVIPKEELQTKMGNANLKYPTIDFSRSAFTNLSEDVLKTYTRKKDYCKYM